MINITIGYYLSYSWICNSKSPCFWLPLTHVHCAENKSGALGVIECVVLVFIPSPNSCATFLNVIPPHSGLLCFCFLISRIEQSDQHTIFLAIHSLFFSVPKFCANGSRTSPNLAIIWNSPSNDATRITRAVTLHTPWVICVLLH